MIAFCVNSTHARPTRKPVHPVAAQDARYRCVRHPNVVVALQIPNNPHRPEVVFAAKTKLVLPKRGRCPVGMTFGDGRCVYKPCLTALSIGVTPTAKARSTDPEMAARPGNVADLFGRSKYSQFALNFALILGHEHLLRSKPASLLKMFRE